MDTGSFQGAKRPEPCADNPSLPSAELQMGWGYHALGVAFSFI